jgi:copper chaperone CopZ
MAKTQRIQSSATTTKRLYLASDPGFLRSYVVSVLILATIVAIGALVPSIHELVSDAYAATNEWMMATAHKYAWWSLLGLLASSCCALQLFLNALSFGCAGLNGVLGPFRPTMLAFATLAQASSWSVVVWKKPSQWRQTAISTVVVAGLALLPELLVCFQPPSTKRRTTIVSSKSTKTTKTKTASRKYRLESIGCSACVTTVSNLLEKLDFVESFDILLEQGGRLSVVLTKHDGIATVDASGILLQAKLEEAGFPIQPLSDETTK